MQRRQFLLAGAALTAAANVRAQARTVALVLGGGGCRGYAHVGVLRVLERHGFRPDLVVGSSVGALVGALYAAGRSSAEIERCADGMSSAMLRGWTLPGLGLFSGSAIRRFVARHAGPGTIESLPTRFAAVATDLGDGSVRVFDRGDLAQAVQASASAPGLVEPVRLDGRAYVDGNLCSPVPVDIARGLGATHVVAVDVTFPPEQADVQGPLDALYQGFSILTRRLALDEGRRADLLVEPQIAPYNDMQPETLKSIVAAGERAANDALPALAGPFGRRRSSHVKANV